MADMAVGHEKATIADPGDAATTHRAGVHRDRFPDGAVLTDHERGRLAPIGQRLRRCSERSEWIHDGARTDPGVSGDIDMRHQPAARTKSNVRTDNAIWLDRHAPADHR